MDRDTAKRIAELRGNYIAGIANLNEQGTETAELNEQEIETRFLAILKKLEALVEHRDNAKECVTKGVPIFRTEGPLPNVSLRFRYEYYTAKDDAEVHVYGNHANEFGENVTVITAEWIHSPDGPNKTAEPGTLRTNSKTALEYGEVFASEAFARFEYDSSPMFAQRDLEFRSLAKLEESLEIYLEALQS